MARSGVNGSDNINNPDTEEIPKLWGFGIQGDERRVGPIYCYARLFTWSQTQRSLLRVFEETLIKLQDEAENNDQKLRRRGERHDSEPLSPHDRPSISQVTFRPLNTDLCSDRQRPRLTSDADTVVQSVSNDPVGTQPHQPRRWKSAGAYRPWSTIDPEIYKHILSGIFMAFIVQWGTTGPAVMLAYKTYTPGLGCRSGSYLVYGVFATVVFAFMLASMLLSHQAMHMVETEYRPHHLDEENAGENHELNTVSTSNSTLQPPSGPLGPSMQGDNTSTASERLLSSKDGHRPKLALPKSRKFVIICTIAILLRQIGKILAIANAMWLIISSLLEFSSGFANCYCQSTYIQLQSRAFVTLFPNAKDLEHKSLIPSAMATLVSGITCLGTIFVFLLSSYY